ncbi:MAG: molybdopterin molybdotransferase MoeA [Acidimicrobiales bacterium]
MSLIRLAEARSFVLDGCTMAASRPVGLAEALGCVTSRKVVAPEPVPPFANTAMDGYAVRAADTTKGEPTRLRIAGSLAAGAAGDIGVGPGEAIRIMTGAPVPEGSDAVVMVEHASLQEGGAFVAVEAVSPGENLRYAGEDIEAGQEVFPERTVLGPGHLGVLASLGCERVETFGRLRVGVLSTGDELVQGDGALRRGQIRDANRPALLGLLRQAGMEGVDLGIARDTEEEITTAVEGGLDDCDAILTSGGVSVGDFDYVKTVLDRLTRGGMRWMQVAVRPAKPLAFGTVAGKPVFGLPGNPVSSMVSFELFARPALRKMMGFSELQRPRVEAVADEPLMRHRDGKTHFVRVIAAADASGRHRVRLSGGQASHMLWAMALANGLAELADGDGVQAGNTVPTLLLDRG